MKIILVLTCSYELYLGYPKQQISLSSIPFLYLSFRFLDPSKYIIQVWTTGSDALIGELLKQKYRLIMSNYDAW